MTNVKCQLRVGVLAMGGMPLKCWEKFSAPLNCTPAVYIVPRLSRPLFLRGGGRHSVVEIILVLFEQTGKQGKLRRVVSTVCQVQSTDIGNQSPGKRDCHFPQLGAYYLVLFVREYWVVSKIARMQDQRGQRPYRPAVAKTFNSRKSAPDIP